MSYSDADEANFVGPSFAPETLDVKPRPLGLFVNLALPFGKRFSVLGKVGINWRSASQITARKMAKIRLILRYKSSRGAQPRCGLRLG